jgi:two-component system, cell cycle sensor histidine kinase and response regulator CckA
MSTKVLIVDDISANLYLLESLLKAYGFEVTSAENGQVALDKAHADPPDLIISDILMPVMDGYTLCRQWKSDEQFKNIPLVFYTATYTSPKEKEFALSLGADRFIIKPEEPDILMSILKELLEDRYAEKQVMTRPLGEEMEFFRWHNEILFRKLEKKMVDLEIANQKLAILEERYRLSFENVTDIIITIDTDLIILSMSPSVERILGYKPQQFIGRPVSDLGIIFTPESLEQAIADIGLILKGETISMAIYRFIVEDGTIKVGEASGSPIWRNGKIIGMISVSRDITERKYAEEERERLITAIEQAGEIIFVTDPKGIIEYVNPAFETVTGYTREEALGQTPRLLKSGKQDQAFYRDLWKTISSGKTWTGLMVNKRKDGSFYTEEATISPVCDPVGRIVNFVAVKRDISKQLILTTQLGQAQRMESIGRLAGGVAHDFNNLLTTIIGNAQLALAEVDKKDDLYQVIEEISKAGERAAGLTGQLLAFSRKQILQPEIVNLNEVVRDVEKILKRLIGEDIELESVLPPDLGQVEADVGQLEQVIINLAVNARDAMPKGGKLSIETANTDLDEEYAAHHVAVTPGPYVVLSVSDNGIGMSREVQDRIFEPFFTTKEKDKGTGLGLSTLYGIVKQSKGNIWVYSEVGQGTTFKVYFPRIDKDVDREKGKRQKEEARGGSETILVVEDEDSLCKLAVKVLKMYGYRVLKAKDGVEALEIFKSYQASVHLLLTDVVMPRMDGRELAGRLEGLQPDLKVLFMSGYTDNAIVHHGILDKGIAFIQKPFTPEDLARKVREVLEG